MNYTTAHKIGRIIQIILACVGLTLGFFIGFSIEESYTETHVYDANKELMSKEINHYEALLWQKVSLSLLFGIMLAVAGFAIGLIIQAIIDTDYL